MSDLDPTPIMAEHGVLHVCIGGLYWNMRVSGDKCDPYRLAEALLKAEGLLGELVDPDPCWFDHNGGCQAHGFISLRSGETCPHADAKALLAVGAA
jgi:hypothetical protein